MSTQPDIYSDNPVVNIPYMVAVMSAAGDHNVQLRTKTVYGFKANPWYLCQTKDMDRDWNWQSFDYRISPDSRLKKTVAMGMEDFPAIVWMRHNTRSDANANFQVVHFSQEFFIIIAGGGQAVTWKYDNAAFQLEYSSDRVNFKPCTKEVPA